MMFLFIYYFFSNANVAGAQVFSLILSAIFLPPVLFYTKVWGFKGWDVTFLLFQLPVSVFSHQAFQTGFDCAFWRCLAKQKVLRQFPGCCALVPINSIFPTLVCLVKVGRQVMYPEQNFHFCLHTLLFLPLRFQFLVLKVLRQAIYLMQ